MKARSVFALAGWATVAAAAWFGYRDLIAEESRRRRGGDARPLPPGSAAASPPAREPAAAADLPRRPAARRADTAPRLSHLRALSGLRPRPAGTSPKARHDDYAPAPFFFEQHNAVGGHRLVAWTGDLEHQRETLATLVQLLAPRVEVLTKVIREDEREETVADHWVRYYGIAPTPALLEAIGRCEAFVFRDSRTQVCARNPWTLEYVVLDHDGCLYVYSTDGRFRDCLRVLGFEERVEALISSRAHWRQLPEEGPAQQTQFVRLLRLHELRPAHEPTPAHEVH
jgi:hypothetical protein